MYRAEQLQPVQREVALKVIKLGMDTPSVVARFETERQALALMDHPGIAAVFDAGSTRSGRPFFVMELVPGEPITRYCETRKLGVEERLRLFVELCRAVQHAHQKGVIHRDIKPSNVLVVETDGVPHPKVIDFGIAKATAHQRLADQTIYTAFDQFIGTPAYMSPEQAGLTGDDVDTRTDIYALGVLLYELLTGTPPFDPQRLRAAAVDEVCRIIRDEEPARPSIRVTTVVTNEPGTAQDSQLISTWARRLRGDLDWIVMKALEKQRARRYDTASDFARDITRHLTNEPVAARPPSSAYRFQKLVRRNKLAFAASAAVITALAIGAIVATCQFYKEQDARRIAVAAEHKARDEARRAEQVARFLKETLAGAGPSVALGRDTTLLREILDRTAERVSQELKDYPEIEAELRATVGKAYLDIGDLGKAEAMLREALRLRETVFGPTRGAVLESILDLCSVLNRRSAARDLVEGESLARRAVAIEEARSPSESAALANALEQLGWNLHCQARWADAEPVYRRVLEIRRLSRGIPETHLVNSLNALSANLSFNPARLDESESLIREALAIQTKSNREAHPATADLLHTLSLVLEKRKKLPEAEEAIEESVRMRRKLWGENNVMLADPLARLAQVLVVENKLDEAEATLRECITILEKSFGTGNLRMTGYHMGTLTELLHRRKKWREAEASVKDWVALCRANHELSNALFHSLHWQGIILIAQRKWAGAEPVLREAISLCDQIQLVPTAEIEATTCVHLRRSLGETLLRRGSCTEAELLLLASYAALKDATGRWDAVETKLSIEQLIELYETTARPTEAAGWKRRLGEFQKVGADKAKAASPH